RPEHDWARSEGLAEPRLLDGRGAAQGRGHSSVDGQGPDAVGGLAPIARAGDDGRPDAAVAMGLQEPRQAGDGASRPGSQSEFLGHVSLGIDHDTGEFAVNAVRCWLDQMGWKLYPGMRRLMITADGGGSNGSRLRLWKLALQQLADETGLIIQVCPYPPGTSKWNKIEHRMFCHITQNWRATPLLSLLIVIELIANTTT